MADWGMKISKPGFDVKTCADKDLVSSSKLNQFKVKSLGSTATSVAHGLSYVPVFMAANEATSTKYGIIGCFFGGIPFVNSTDFDSGGATSKYYLFYHGST